LSRSAIWNSVSPSAHSGVFGSTQGKVGTDNDLVAFDVWAHRRPPTCLQALVKHLVEVALELP
jgi:hypothetical protein